MRAIFPAVLVAALATGGCLQTQFPTACENNEAECIDHVPDGSSAETSTIGSDSEGVDADDSSSEETSDASTIDSDADTEIADAADSTSDSLAVDTGTDTGTVDSGPVDIGIDTPPACAASSYSCIGDELRQCKSDGTGYTSIVICPVGTCSATAGRCTFCTPGTLACSGSQPTKCNAVGSAYSPNGAACVAPQTCGGGGATGLCGCTPITACPTGKVCGSYPNGCGGTITCGTCSSGKTCNGANACVCAPNAYLCSGATLLRCAVDGSDYASVATCPSASLCDASLGRCTECTPSSYYCVGADRYSCSSVGIGSKVATCINAALCASGSGASCGTPVCATDEKTCSGSTARTCNATRTGWVDEACAIGCAAGSCIKVSTLADGSGQHMCVALTNGTVRCWGATADGATGDAPLPHNKPVPVSGLTSIAQVVIAQGRSGARRSDGTLLWWGRVYSSTEPSGVIIKTPATIPGVTSTTSMSLGWFSACGVKTDGTIVCYGKGPLGDSTANAFDPAKANPYLTGILSVAQSSGTFGFALSGSDARGWGYDSWGVLGTGSTTDHLIPVSTFGGAIQIAPGGNHTCALILGGGVRCSGNNDYGQLGDNTLTTNNSPVDVTGVGAAKATQICSGSIHSCARLDDSTVKCWGANNRGQLGDGTKTNRKMATAVLGLTGATKVACGYNASCALMSDGLVKCWGSNAEGELGDGTTLTERLTPWPVAW